MNLKMKLMKFLDSLPKRDFAFAYGSAAFP